MVDIDTSTLTLIARKQKLTDSDRKAIREIAASVKKLLTENKNLNNTMYSEAKLKRNPIVKEIILNEKEKNLETLEIKNTQFQKQLKLKEDEILKLKERLNALKTKPISKTEFNTFMSQSIADLQVSFDKASQTRARELIIRDVEIEASVITELKNNQPVYIIPSREDMKNLEGQYFQKIKYYLSMVPKDE